MLNITEKQKEKFEQFVSEKDVNCSLYFNIGPFQTYVRKTIKIINGQKKHVICRANTTNKKRNFKLKTFKRSGLYRLLDDYMTVLAKKYGYDGIEVECVINQHLQSKMHTYGYVCYDESAKSYWESF